MIISDEEKETMSIHHSRNVSLCIMCQKYCGGCLWSKWFMPVRGWTAITSHKKNGDIKRAWVGWCPEFKADAGLYDMIVHGDPHEGRWYCIRQYGHMIQNRYTTIRYHLVNDYERTDDDNKTILQGGGLSLRQANEENKRKMLDTLAHKMEMHR